MTHTLFGEIASNVFHLSFLARHLLVNTGKACNNFDSPQEADVSLRRIWEAVPKWERMYVRMHEVHFFPLQPPIFVWTFQPSFEIGMDTSTRNSAPMIALHLFLLA